MNFFIHVIRNDKIGRVLQLALSAQISHNIAHGVLIEPVVGIDHLEIATRRIGETGIHRGAVAAVFLMNRNDRIGIATLPLIGLFRSVVLRRAIVDDNDFDVAAIAEIARKDRFDALIHIGSGVVARNGE